MKDTNISLKTFIALNKIITENSRKFSGGLDGIGFNEFVILYHLHQSPDHKMRRIDLADKVGLTASGVTRLLAPMEKIGLIQKESSSRDARVSFVAITDSGKRNFTETLAKTESFFEGIFPSEKLENMSGFLEMVGL